MPTVSDSVRACGTTGDDCAGNLASIISNVTDSIEGLHTALMNQKGGTNPEDALNLVKD